MLFLAGCFWYFQVLFPHSALTIPSDINIIMADSQNNSVKIGKLSIYDVQSYINPGKQIQLRNQVQNWEEVSNLPIIE
jgi:hypothetical protein